MGDLKCADICFPLKQFNEVLNWVYRQYNNNELSHSQLVNVIRGQHRQCEETLSQETANERTFYKQESNKTDCIYKNFVSETLGMLIVKY